MTAGQRRIALRLLAGAGALVWAPALASATPVQRFDRTLNGDFLIIGNTIGYDCGGGVAPPTGATASCGTLTDADTAVDAFWVDSAAGGGPATNARTSAKLDLPADATVVRAQLYWAGLVTGSAGDGTVHIDRPSDLSADLSDTEVQTLTFPSGLGSATAYQATAEVTSLVQTLRAGIYRVGGIDVRLLLTGDELAFGGWVLVVVYEQAGAPLRRISLFDGLTAVAPGSDTAVTVQTLNLAGNLVGALGVWGFEGDAGESGDRVTVDGVPVTGSAQNPTTNFFNGSRTLFEVPVAGTVPALSGAARTLAGVDLDVVDISERLSAAATQLTVGASTTDDAFWLGGLLTSLDVPARPPDAAPPPVDAPLAQDGPGASDGGADGGSPDGAGATGDGRTEAIARDGSAAPDGGAPNDGPRAPREAGDDAGNGLHTVLGGSGCACQAGGRPPPSGAGLAFTLAGLTAALNRRRRRAARAGSDPAPARTP